MLESGKWDKLPHYVIHGQPQQFYVWVNEDGRGSNTRWISGNEAFTLYNKFRAIKNKKEFILLTKQVHKEYR